MNKLDLKQIILLDFAVKLVYFDSITIPLPLHNIITIYILLGWFKAISLFPGITNVYISKMHSKNTDFNSSFNHV